MDNSRLIKNILEHTIHTCSTHNDNFSGTEGSDALSPIPIPSCFPSTLDIHTSDTLKPQEDGRRSVILSFNVTADINNYQGSKEAAQAVLKRETRLVGSLIKKLAQKSRLQPETSDCDIDDLEASEAAIDDMRPSRGHYITRVCLGSADFPFVSGMQHITYDDEGNIKATRKLEPIREVQISRMLIVHPDDLEAVREAAQDVLIDYMNSQSRKAAEPAIPEGECIEPGMPLPSPDHTRAYARIKGGSARVVATEESLGYSSSAGDKLVNEGCVEGTLNVQNGKWHLSYGDSTGPQGECSNVTVDSHIRKSLHPELIAQLAPGTCQVLLDSVRCLGGGRSKEK